METTKKFPRGADFPAAARCAFVTPNAQRASYASIDDRRAFAGVD
jgi:hypothetical protein